MMPPPWYPPPPTAMDSALNPATNHSMNPMTAPVTNPAPTKSLHVEYPNIGPWLKYCDRHPRRSGDDLGALADKFSEEGFRDIGNLSGPHISVEELSKWLGIKHGLTLCLLSYADEDVELAKAGTFSFTLPGDGEV